ncbi:caspase family protein [Streptomyces sp. NPDC056600]|uniref:effector-associated domain 2-containing protein n=1 Tax=Streptomyces sp. NPDC056600 TaxID=3345874 RepID=UPI0036AC6E33
MNGPDVAPERIHALVVGVERYRAGHLWDLPGPAQDALRFRDWLLARGVPEDNVLLCLGALPGPSAAVPHLPADYATVRDLAVQRLSAVDGDLLWVWWGGHGVLDKDESLRLLTADAGTDDKRNLHLPSLLRRLAGDALPGFSRQIMVVDACQIFEEEYDFHDTLPTDLLPAGQRNQVHDQAVLLSASRGQRAGNDPVRGTGLFSDCVLRVLETFPDAAPDADPVFDSALRRFTEVTGKTGQHPYVLRERTGRGRETLRPPAPRRASPAPAVVPPVSARQRLINVLLGYSVLLGREARQTLVSLLETRRVERMPRGDNPRGDLSNIVLTLAEPPSELWLLHEAVITLDPDETRAAELAAAIDAFARPRSPDSHGPTG